MHDFDQFERRFADALRSDADSSVAPFEPASIARDAIAGTNRRAAHVPRAPSRTARQFGRGRGLTLLAAALLLVGGAMAAGSGLVRLPSLVPPEPAPSLAVAPTPSRDANPSDDASPSAIPSIAPASGASWTATGSMTTPRRYATAVLLATGKVLVFGGVGSDSGCCPTSAELYDPSTGTWTATGSMVATRADHTTTLLRDGRVLVTGGEWRQRLIRRAV